MKTKLIAILILLVGLTACAIPQPTQTPDIPATVRPKYRHTWILCPRPRRSRLTHHIPRALPTPRRRKGRHIRPTRRRRRCLPPPLIQLWQRSPHIRLTQRPLRGPPTLRIPLPGQLSVRKENPLKLRTWSSFPTAMGPILLKFRKVGSERLVLSNGLKRGLSPVFQKLTA